MYNKWTKDLSDSVRALEGIRYDYLPRVISGKIHNIEAVDNDILIKLDQMSGIDYIRENDIGLQGIAARVQWGHNWDTFTIRSSRHTGTETELSKRKKAIAEGYFYPAFTLQAYFTNRQENRLLSLGVVKTLDLYEFIIAYPELVEERESDNKFLVVKWSDLWPSVKVINNAV